MSAGEVFGRTIQLFLVDGKPSGLRKATIHGWTGLVFVSNQASFSKLMEREEVKRTGVYVLAGPDTDDPVETRVYIGEADNVAKRVSESAGTRTFWETAVTLTTSDDDLTKGHGEYLEARLIQMVDEARRMKLDNTKKPDPLRRRLPEADVANMEQLLSNFRLILPVIGLDMLKPQPRAVTETSMPVGERTAGDALFEIRHKSGVQATAVEEDGEFIVLEGSEALAGTGHVQHQSYEELKSTLMSKGVLEWREANGKFVFTRPYPFKSPSAAGAVVLDRTSNGRIEWKVKGSKQTYHDWQQAQAAKQEAQAAKQEAAE